MTETYKAVPLKNMPQVSAGDNDEPLVMGRALSGDKYANVIAPVEQKEEQEEQETVNTPLASKISIPLRPRPRMRPAVLSVPSVSVSVESKPPVDTPQEKSGVVEATPSAPAAPAPTTNGDNLDVSTVSKKGRFSIWNWNLQVKKIASPKEPKPQLTKEEIRNEGKGFALWGFGLFLFGLVVSISPLLLNFLMSAWWMLLTVPLGILFVIAGSLVSGVGFIQKLWLRFKNR